jgi:hypothetical protein
MCARLEVSVLSKDGLDFRVILYPWMKKHELLDAFKNPQLRSFTETPVSLLTYHNSGDRWKTLLFKHTHITFNFPPYLQDPVSQNFVV